MDRCIWNLHVLQAVCCGSLHDMNFSETLYARGDILDCSYVSIHTDGITKVSRLQADCFRV